jgi:hypothetical protein
MFSLPYITKEGAGGPPQPGFTGGWLGRNRDPLFVLRDPSSPSFAMPELGLGSGMHRRRLDQRRVLANAIGSMGQDRSLQDMDEVPLRARYANQGSVYSHSTFKRERRKSLDQASVQAIR